jgi:hypothetical protein
MVETLGDKLTNRPPDDQEVSVGEPAGNVSWVARVTGNVSWVLIVVGQVSMGVLLWGESARLLEKDTRR